MEIQNYQVFELGKKFGIDLKIIQDSNGVLYDFGKLRWYGTGKFNQISFEDILQIGVLLGAMYPEKALEHYPQLK